MCDVKELSIDEDLSVYVNIPDFVDLDSDNETDYSADEAENPVNIDEEYVFKKEEAETEVTPVKAEPLEERIVEQVVYNNSKYFKKQKPLQNNTNNHTRTDNVQANTNQILNTNGKRRRSDSNDVQIKQEPDNYIKQENDNQSDDNVKSISIKTELISNEIENVKTEPDEDKTVNDLETQALKKYDEIRKWVYTRLGDNLRTGASQQRYNNVKFRIMSYNVLSQGRVDRKVRSFRNKNPNHLAWSKRLQLLTREISSSSPDIICFQELDFIDDNNINGEIEQLMRNLGYDFKSMKRKDPKMDGCAIFYKTEKFTCDKVTYCELDNNDVEYMTDGNNVGIVCRLNSVHNSQKVVVGNVHLKFGPDRQLSRLAQFAVFMADLQELCQERSDGAAYPCIITGDFNLEPYSDVHSLLVKGKLRYRGLLLGTDNYPDNLFPPNFGIGPDMKWSLSSQQHNMRSGCLYHNLGFRSVYQYREERTLYLGFAPPEAEITAFQGKWVACDHMFYSTMPLPDYSHYSSHDGRIEWKLKLLSKWTLPSGSQISKLGGLPSSICPSDHLPLAAEFLLAPQH